MAVRNKQAVVATYATPEEALSHEGPVGTVTRKTFDEHLNSPEIQRRLDRARGLLEQSDPKRSGLVRRLLGRTD
jgi:hypothetical protein